MPFYKLIQCYYNLMCVILQRKYHPINSNKTSTKQMHNKLLRIARNANRKILPKKFDLMSASAAS